MNGLSLSELKKGITHLLYPLLCEGCNKPLVGAEEVLCIACEAELPETGYHEIADNETALRFAGRIPYQHATSFAYFTDDGLLQHLLHGLKYRGRRDIGTYLGTRFAERLNATSWFSGVNMIVPVPLFHSKLAGRGYNQSWIIAEAIGKATGRTVSEGILTRVRDTETQTHKTRAERAANMDGAFAPTNKDAIAGKHILIIDDVLTTGATIEACARALSEAENVKISIATIGIAIS